MRMMKSRSLRRLGLGLAIAMPLIGLIVWYVVIPRVIVAAIRQRHEGHVTIAGWWISGSSAGVTGLTLRETPAPDSPTWAAIDRVSTDLTLGALLRGRFIPRRIVFDRATITYRIAADGHPLTRIPLRPSQGGALPALVVHDSRLTLHQEGRPEMVVHHLDADMADGPDGPHFEAKADDSRWGLPNLTGQFTPDFAGFGFQLRADHLVADREKVASIPFVDGNIWKYVKPDGSVGIDLTCATAKAGGAAAGSEANPDPLDHSTTVILEGTTIGLPTLGLTGEGASGRLTIHDKVVKLDDVNGRMAGGRVAISGPIDFRHQPDRYDLALQLDGVDLTALPESWQLHRIGVRGRFTGTAGLHLALTPDGLDLTGSTGEGTVDGAEVRGIPLERLGLTLRGEGLRRGEGRGARGEEDKTGFPSSSPLASNPSPLVRRPSSLPQEGPFLPQWIAAEFRVKDVEMNRALARVETPDREGGLREVPVSGRVGLEASVRFPLGALEDLKAYQAHGTADMAGATIGGLDLGRIRARFDLTGGILEVDGLRGRMVDRPAGGGRPAATDAPPAEGPLPRGGFRGRVRAELTGDHGLAVDMEGVELPVAELLNVSPSIVPPSAPPTLRGFPIAGLLTIRAQAKAKGRDSWDPRTWTLSGQAEMPEVSYQSLAVKDVTTKVAIESGHLLLTDLAGHLGAATLRGRLALDLAKPWEYDADLNIGDLSCQGLIALIPHAPKSPEVEGTLAGRGEARGTLEPWRIASSGHAKVAALKVGRVAIGDIPLAWSTRGDTIAISAEEHQRYGGRVSAEARIPVAGVGPIEGTITLSKVDTAELSAHAPASAKLTGHADGQARFRYSPGSSDHEHQDIPLEADAHLTAGDLKVGGVPARSVDLTMTVHQGAPRFDLRAEGLGGKIRVTGDGHLATDVKDDEIRAQVTAIGLQLYEVWGALGTSGPLSDLRGRASVKGRVELRGGPGLDNARGQGSIELDQPIWGYDYQLGTKLLADVSKSPDGWRVGPLGGEVFGGKVLGNGIWMYRGQGGRPMFGVDARIERLILPRALSFIPEADRRFAGTGTLTVSGRTDGAIGGTGEFRVDRGFVNSLELTDLHVPGEWTFTARPTQRGSLTIRRAAGRLAGGRVGGEAQFALGDRRDFRVRLTVDDVDLRVISRDELGSRPVPGRLSGYVNVYGTDPAQPASYRGDLDFDLDQASLVDIPLLDELDRALGSTEGGVFDDGDLHGTISDRRIRIDRLTLVGPLAQVHAAGTMDFDGRLNLEVIVNKNRGIPESGQVLLARSPNVADEVARRASQIDQVRDFISSRLMKFRITGTIRDPIANVDRSINPRAAIGFFLKTVWLSSQSR